MSPSFDLENSEHFTAAAVGNPGERVFYLQGQESSTLVTLKVEKEHVGALAEHLNGLLVRLPAAEKSAAAAGDPALREPVEPAWAVGALGVGYDQERDRIVIEAHELLEEGSEAEPATARFRITRVQAQAFVERARVLLKAGRPTCPMCGNAREADGHACPRGNGHMIGRT